MTALRVLIRSAPSPMSSFVARVWVSLLRAVVMAYLELVVSIDDGYRPIWPRWAAKVPRATFGAAVVGHGAFVACARSVCQMLGTLGI